MDMSQAVNVDMAPESLAPGSLLGSLQRTYCQDTRFSQASKLEKGKISLCVHWRRPPGRLLSTSAVPAHQACSPSMTFDMPLPISAGKASSRASSGW